jgi:hypothetical protein
MDKRIEHEQPFVGNLYLTEVRFIGAESKIAGSYPGLRYAIEECCFSGIGDPDDAAF